MKKILFFLIFIFISGCVSEKTIEYKNPVDLENEIKTFTVRENIFIDGVLYKVTAVESYIEIGENEVSQKASGLFYMIYLLVENKELPNGYIISPEIKLIDGLGRIYYPDLKAKFYVKNLFDWEKNLLPGKTYNGVLVFDVPADVRDFKLEIRNNWNEVEKVYITIPNSLVVSKEISEGVVKAREENELLNASIN